MRQTSSIFDNYFGHRVNKSKKTLQQLDHRLVGRPAWLHTTFITTLLPLQFSLYRYALLHSIFYWTTICLHCWKIHCMSWISSRHEMGAAFRVGHGHRGIEQVGWGNEIQIQRKSGIFVDWVSIVGGAQPQPRRCGLLSSPGPRQVHGVVWWPARRVSGVF